MLTDVIELIEIIKAGLEDENQKLNTIIELYDSYRLLHTAILSANTFTTGIFSLDIEEPIFQETESFATPEKKWHIFLKKS